MCIKFGLVLDHERIEFERSYNDQGGPKWPH